MCLLAGRLVAGWWQRGGLRAVRCVVVGHSMGAVTYMLRMLTKWSHPTRLGTRIKESNIRASAEVAKTSTRNESKGSFGGLR